MPLPERGYADLSRARVEESNTSKIGEGWKKWGGGAAGVSKAEDKLADHGIFATNVGPAGKSSASATPLPKIEHTIFLNPLASQCLIKPCLL
jgi:hypothetical protein